jgi:hypothetical protein
VSTPSGSRADGRARARGLRRVLRVTPPARVAPLWREVAIMQSFAMESSMRIGFFERIYYDFILDNRSAFIDSILARLEKIRSSCTYDIYCMSGVEEDVMAPTGVSANVLIRHDGTVEVTNLSQKLLFHDEAIIELRPRRKHA